MNSLAALALLTGLQGVNAWGSLGHQTVAFIAQHYVTESTASWAQKILGDTSSSYLATVAPWADDYRYTAAGSFSAPFHFIDANDSPPSSCNVDFQRDCGSLGCSVSAIANYTERVSDSSLSSDEVQDALKFIVHFLGDITQPLHDEAYEVGGNDVDVTFDGNDTNLHHIWDTNMPEQLRGGYTISDASSWATDLVKQISSGSYANQSASWTQGDSLSDVQGSAMRWASDANSFVCTTVAPNGFSTLENGDLYPSYYNDAITVVELQIAKAGFRLANWLNMIAAAGGSSDDSDYEKRAIEARIDADPLGTRFLPLPKRELSKAELARAAVGYGCKH